MGTWNRFWSLSRPDRSAALEAAAVIAASRVGLRVLGYRRWKSFLSRWPLRKRSATPVRDTGDIARDNSLNHFARISRSAARNLFFHPTCLERSFGLWWLLQRRGFDADLRIGGRKEHGQFEAHAWVEYAGTSLNDAGDDSRFSVFGHSGGVGAREVR
ncbi:MAG TPA: lasso peptide biosynthesis B2 protein [Candidatus Acidoferrales bacterium]|nr:lasso peptide biosynthesis B2 protein [Candidatus Acidoferrales bacterium]